MWVRGLGWERIPRGLRRRSNRGDSFSPPSVLAAEMMSACGQPPLKTPKKSISSSQLRPTYPWALSRPQVITTRIFENSV